MKTAILIAGALALLPASVPAQTIGDDLRCLLLANVFVRAAKDENTRRVSALTGAFYLGRVNSRVPAASLAQTLRAQGPGVPAKEAAAAMQACAKRAQLAETQMAAAAKQIPPAKPAARPAARPAAQPTAR